MKLIQQTSLWFSEGASDKVYEVDLCEVGTNQFVVNFRYGRRGTTLRDGTKTTLPVPEEQARKTYDLLVNSKKREGYQEVGGGSPTPTVLPTTAPIGTPSPADRTTYLLGLLQSAGTTGKLPASAKWPLSRAIWRAGELRLREAVPLLLALVPKSDALQQYCLAWALGRCGDEAALPTLEKLRLAPASTDAVKRAALLSELALARGQVRTSLVAGVLDSLPADVRVALTGGSEAALHQLLTETLGIRLPYDTLETLYLLADDYPAVRSILLEHLPQLPWQAHKSGQFSTFRCLRHVFKIAEFREDGLVFGLLARRFEKIPSLFRFSFWGDYAYTTDGDWFDNGRKEIKKENSKLAYSNDTRAYLRRRAWRTLRTLGEDSSAAYVSMAVGVLLAFSDAADDSEPRTVRYEWYNWRQRSNQVRVTHYDSYAAYGVFNHLLYTHSPRYEYRKNARAWRCQEGYQAGQPEPAVREEAFPRLWDQQPEALLTLLLESRVARVHAFAAKALRTHPRFPELLNPARAGQLLSQPYAVTVNLALAWLRAHYQPAKALTQSEVAAAEAVALLGQLIQHPVAEARTLAREWLAATPSILFNHPLIFARTLINPHADVAAWLHTWLDQHSPTLADAQVLVGYGLAELLSLENTEMNGMAADAASHTLLERMGEPLRSLQLEIVMELLQHPLSAVQELGAGILLRHQIPAADLPPSVIASLVRATTPTVRQAGVQLFGQLPAARLLESQDVLLSFAVSAYPEIRQAVRPVITSLVAQYPDAGATLIRRAVPLVQTQEPFEGLHEDLFELITGELGAFLSAIDLETSWQLLHSRRRVNQRLGSVVLEKNITDAQLSIRQVVKLADHELLGVRQRAWQVYERNAARVRTEPEEALRLLDVTWEDSRQFAMAYFRQHWGESDWTPTRLVSVCDSTRPDVRQFGRELITRFFTQADGLDYLLKLSQHPSADLQLFATNYLQQFATGQPDTIEALAAYFTTVLSQVNRAGVAKARVFAFLRREALRDEQTARLVARLAIRQSATVAIADKAACLQILRDIRRAYPHLELPFTIQPPREFSHQ